MSHEHLREAEISSHRPDSRVPFKNFSRHYTSTIEKISTVLQENWSSFLICIHCKLPSNSPYFSFFSSTTVSTTASDSERGHAAKEEKAGAGVAVWSDQ